VPCTARMASGVVSMDASTVDAMLTLIVSSYKQSPTRIDGPREMSERLFCPIWTNVMQRALQGGNLPLFPILRENVS
jgi:hypothetical protein